MAEGWPNVAVWYSGGLVESNGSWTCAAGCTSFVAIDHSSLDFFLPRAAVAAPPATEAP